MGTMGGTTNQEVSVKIGKNPFGSSTVLAAKTVSKEGEEKKVDLVGVYLAAVPALQKAKDSLIDVRDSLRDGPNSQKCDEWVKQIVALIQDILEHTKVAVSAEIEQAAPSAAPAPVGGKAPAITADMIAGKTEIPAGTVK